jgi:restriction modification system DNA specificity domain protein
LIESKKQFKKALMQNLLTAKIRFPQFKDEWRAIKLGEICDISTGTSKSRFIGDGKFYIVAMGSITQDGLLNLTKTTNLSQDFLDCGDLVMPKDDIGGGKIIGKVAVIDKDNTYVLSDHIFRIKTTENSNFLAYLINSNLINKKIRREVSGTAQLGLSKRTIENLKIKLPNLKEQQKIAEVLMACDDEINLLNLKLENLKKQKQGLMQKLLSAKVRI